MKRGFALLAAVYIAFMTYGVELYVWGDHGILAYNDLAMYKQRLEENIEELKKTGAELRREAESLQYSAEKVALYARKLGYFDSDEQHLRVEGMKLQKEYYVVGELVKPYSRSRIDRTVFRIIAFLAGGIGYIVLRFRKQLQ